MRAKVFAPLASLIAAGVVAHAMGGESTAPPGMQLGFAVTVGADLKQLVFDWDPVPGARWYQLQFKAGASARYAVVDDRIPASRTRARVTVPVHGLDWQGAHYRVSACNRQGCRESAPLPVAGHGLAAIGYLKASNTEAHDHFGRHIQISGDGRTLVVAATLESGGAAGVNGDQSDNSQPRSGAAYVFRRTGSGWRQEAYLKGDAFHEDRYFGGSILPVRPVSVSADGSIVAIGSAHERRGQLREAGAVYLYGRAANGSWSLLQKLHSPSPRESDYFGLSLDLSGDASTLRVASALPSDAEGKAAGRQHVFVRVNGTWVHDAELVPHYLGEDLCPVSRMSGDASTLIFLCHSTVTGGHRVVTHKRVGGVWTYASEMALQGDAITQDPALSFSATRLALRHGTGSRSAARLYRWNGANWIQEAELWPTEGAVSDGNTWATEIAFNRDGTRVALGDPLSPVAGAGVSEDLQPGTGADGAIFIYERTATPTARWVFRRQVKAPDPETGDGFGLQVALDASGDTLVAGAPWEDSAATGVDGRAADAAAENAGAVYLY